MATDLDTTTDLEAYHQFVEKLLEQGKRKMSVEESLSEFREYQKELERLREEIRPAMERSLRGESKSFNPEELKARVTRELEEKGITD